MERVSQCGRFGWRRRTLRSATWLALHQLGLQLRIPKSSYFRLRFRVFCPGTKSSPRPAQTARPNLLAVGQTRLAAKAGIQQSSHPSVLRVRRGADELSRAFSACDYPSLIFFHPRHGLAIERFHNDRCVSAAGMIKTNANFHLLSVWQGLR